MKKTLAVLVFVLFFLGVLSVMFKLAAASDGNKVWFEVGHGYWCSTNEDIVTNLPYQRSHQWLFQIVNLEDETGQPVTNPGLTVFTDREFVSFGPSEPIISDGKHEWDFALELPEYSRLPAFAAEPNHIDYSRPGFSAERSVSPEVLVESVTMQNLSLAFTLEDPLPADVNRIEIFIGVPDIVFQKEKLVNYTILLLNEVEDWSSEGNGWLAHPSNISLNKTYHFEATLEAVKSPNLGGITVKPAILILYIHQDYLGHIGTGSSATITHPEGPTVTVSADGEYEWYGGISYSRQDFWINQVVGPVASFTHSPSTSYTGETVIFNASASYDPDGYIVSYGWDFDDGNITTVSDQIVAHTYAKPGTYNVTLTVRDAAGSESTRSTSIIVLPAKAIREPRSLHVVAAVGAAVTAATAAVASFGGLGRSFNSAISKLPIPDRLKDFLQLYSEEIFATVDKVKLEALEKASFITKGELAALGISAFVMTIVFGFVEANGLPHFLNPSVLVAVIPSTLLSVCMVSIAGELSEALCARTCGVYRQFRLWMYGLGAFLISGLLFLFPFSSPGITRYQSGEISNKTKGLIVLSKMLVLLTLTIPFAGLFMLGFKVIGDAGLLLTLMTVCYSLVPLKPLAGKAVFEYRKEVSLIALVSAGILFYGCTVNLLPHVTYLAVGVVSLFLAAITLSQLRKRG